MSYKICASPVKGIYDVTKKSMDVTFKWEGTISEVIRTVFSDNSNLTTGNASLQPLVKNMPGTTAVHPNNGNAWIVTTLFMRIIFFSNVRY